MKNILLVIILAVFTKCGTDQNNDRKTLNYTIINESSLIVEIIPYDENDVKDLKRKIVLGNKQSIKKELKTNTGANDRLLMKQLIYPSNLTLNKIDIIFNNTKKVVYYNNCYLTSQYFNECGKRNLFQYEFNDEDTEIYTITPEDYQNAIDCGGACN